MKSRLLRLIRKHGLEDRREQILATSGPGLRLRTIRARKPLPRGSSKLGGDPDLPRGFKWPMRGKRPLVFVGQMSMSDVPESFRWPPAPGLLSFFYDVREQPWGFAPSDRSGSRVVWTPGDPKRLASTRGPVPRDKESYDGGPLRECRLALEEILTIPPVDNTAIAPVLAGKGIAERYFEMYGEYVGTHADGWHQFGGWPQPEQSDLELECQLPFHGIDMGGDDAFDRPEIGVLAGGASRWQLLLQVCSDDNLGVMWGDLGKIYFYTTAESRAALTFKEAWTVLQCG